MKQWMLTAVLVLAAGAAVAGDKIERQVKNDPNYQTNIAQAVKILEARGYQVKDVDADEHLGKPALDVDAVKNNQKYDIKLSYPDLNVIDEKIDR